MTAARSTTAGLWDAGLPIVPRPPRAARWEATLLAVPVGSGKTLVAGGTIKAGVFTWAIPRRPAVG